jgi:hypothetical protein
LQFNVNDVILFLLSHAKALFDASKTSFY